MSEKQTTIKKSVSISGTGIHTGEQVNLTFHPAKADEGYLFTRPDIEGKPTFKAHIDNVISTDRSTTIGKDGVTISTVEHALAALSGMQIDNVFIELDGNEVPWLDGSALGFVKVLEEAGIEELEAEREYLEIGSNISFEDKEKNIELIIMPADTMSISSMISFEHPSLNAQYAVMNDLENFKTDIAPARSFALINDIKPLLDNGLIKGGDLDNSVVYADSSKDNDILEQLAKELNIGKVEISDEGLVGNTKLRFDNEAARHKLLDLMGDLALLGKPIKGQIIARRPGHKANNALVKNIKKRYLSKQDSIPAYDPNKKPIYDINDIKKMLPHRPPFLLVDKILEISETHVVGMKNVTMNEGFFVGHFPNEPVMPGVLQIEAMAQTGGILVLSTLPDPENYATYFVKIDAVKFRAKVIPGDTIIFNLHLASPIRRGMVHMIGKGYVGTKCCIEATMLAQVVKTK